MPGSATPAGRDWSGHYASPAAFRSLDGVTLPRSGNFGIPLKGLHTRCLRFAVPGTRTPRKTRFRQVVNLYQAGLITRWILDCFVRSVSRF